MKKFILAVVILLSAANVYATGISVDPFISPDDVTIPHLEQFRTRVVDAINSFPGTNIQAGTIPSTALDANANVVTRWAEAFNNFVYVGLLPTTTVGTLTSTQAAGTAYINGYRVVKDAVSHLYGANKWTYIDLSQNGTYTYSETAIGVAEPSVAAQSIRLCRVVTDATAITSVRDDRILAISLGVNEDFYIKGLQLSWRNATQISVDAGLLHNGTAVVSKISDTILDVSVASNYTTGASQRGTNKWLYVYADTNATLAFDQAAPNTHDVLGHTAGILYYYYDGAKYWRCIGAIRLNSTGSGEVFGFFQNGNKINYNVPGVLTTTKVDSVWTSLSCAATMPAISRLGEFWAMGDTSVAGDYARISLRPKGSTWTTDPYFGLAAGVTVGTMRGISTQIQCQTNSGQEIEYYTIASMSAAQLGIGGYYIDIR